MTECCGEVIGSLVKTVVEGNEWLGEPHQPSEVRALGTQGTHEKACTVWGMTLVVLGD